MRGFCRGFVILLLLTGAAVGSPYSKLDVCALEPQEIRQMMRAVAEYQLKSYGRPLPEKRWTVGTFFSAFVTAYEATGDSWYLDQAQSWAEGSSWDVRNALNADDVCPGQTYLDLYAIRKNPGMVKALNEKLSSYFGRTYIEADELPSKNARMSFTGRNLWSWCDALYMAPPVYAAMGRATGDPRYVETLHALYWDAVDYLYDKDEALFYRDSRFFPENQKSPSGRKIFWSRGNGWVIAGLVRILESLPQDDPLSEKYLGLFKELAFSVVRYQQEDGLWRASLNEPDWLPVKESSGSSLFIYAISRGINNGWLPREYFLPAMVRGWSGLCGCVAPDGQLRYCQTVATAPHRVRPMDTQDYAAGVFILAASEILKLNALPDVMDSCSAAFDPQCFAKDGTWPAVNAGRAVIGEKFLVAGYVKSNGQAALTSLNLDPRPSISAQNDLLLDAEKVRGNIAILPLTGGNFVVSYTTESSMQSFLKLNQWRVPLISDEQVLEAVAADRGPVHQELISLSDEKGRIYKFFSAGNGDIYFSISDDKAANWSKALLFISAGAGGLCPDIRYVSNGRNRIDFFYTDGEKNHIYHFYFLNGVFCQSSGTLIRTMAQLQEQPVAPAEGTLVFDGGKTARCRIGDLEYDQAGRPSGVFSVGSEAGGCSQSARFIDGKWNVKRIAFGDGGIALDPTDDNRVIFSSNVHPAGGGFLPNRLYQLFEGTCENGDWKWVQLTHDPVMNHSRPVLVRNRSHTLLWCTDAKGRSGDILFSLDY